MTTLTTTLRLDLVNDSSQVQLTEEPVIIREEASLIELQSGPVTAILRGGFHERCVQYVDFDPRVVERNANCSVERFHPAAR